MGGLDGLTIFAPAWAAAMLFSVAGDPWAIAWRGDTGHFVISWICIGAALALMARPRDTRLLALLAACMVARYAWLVPVASNNQSIAVLMNLAILCVLAQSALSRMSGRSATGATEAREISYERLRVVARGLLAVMYFYGIFHKINTDFLDPEVSCAVALYRPLAAPFGLADNIYGRYLAIWSTFIIETITLVALYWRRWFAVGLFCGLVFHYVIPITGYSWYKDFSSLSFALYVLSIPLVVSSNAYASVAAGLATARERLSLPRGIERLGLLVPLAAVLSVAGLLAISLALGSGADRPTPIWRTAWMMVWAIYGGIAMVVLVWAAMPHLPWRGSSAGLQPLWLYAFPAALLVMGASPYVGLKTESSIAMFSNLHTEGGVTNHLLFDEPPYLFDYQKDLVELVGSSMPHVQRLADEQQQMVFFAVEEELRRNPGEWMTYRRDGELHTRVTADAFAPEEHANPIERAFLVFKPVDFRRPKVCTH